ncbi:MAG: 1-acyl-sn-glycerol-3-phosphate acyltransferase [Treponema sp.]|nr:1-acyl-sn-glycerol-3-phosphate acyltransferase [Treponema sp.]
MPAKESRKAKPFRKASSFIAFLLRPTAGLVLHLLYRFGMDRKSTRGIKRPCLIIANHQTSIDQFIVGLGFKFGINYVASDTIFRHGLLSKLMVALVRPIPFSKGNSDLTALKNMMSVIKDGGCVCMFPSGNRSFYGEESTIVPGIGKLAKKFAVPLVLVQFRGGYNMLPRWKTRPNGGKTTGTVVRVVTPEELAAMSAGEVDEAIRQVICYNEFEYNKTAQIAYPGRRKAEYLESVLFYCPQCSNMDGLCSKGNEFFCRHCGARVRINDTGFFERVENSENRADKLPDTILEWSYRQLEYIKSLDYSAFTDKALFSDANVTFLKAERAKKEEFLAKGDIEFYADRLVVCGREFLLAEITTAVHGVRKMTIYGKEGVFAVISPHRTNLMKYMICGYHLRNKALNIMEEFYGY